MTRLQSKIHGDQRVFELATQLRTFFIQLFATLQTATGYVLSVYLTYI
jgi:hypothetical protein